MPTVPFPARLRLAMRALIGTLTPGSVGASLLSGIFPSAGNPPSRNTEEFLAAYTQMPWLRAVVHRISDSTSTIHWTLSVAKNAQTGRRVRDTLAQTATLVERTARHKALLKAGEMEILLEHPLLTLLSQGNTYLTGITVRKLIQIDLELVGEAFLILERNPTGMPVALWPVPPSWVQSTPTIGYPFYRVQFRGWSGAIPETEILAFHDPNPRNPYGRGAGTAQALADELETDEYAAKHVKNWFWNRARPDLIITAEGLRQDETVRLEHDWVTKLQGFWNCHDEQTEVLTRHGWIPGVTVTKDHEIATWNEELQRLEYHHPTNCYRYAVDTTLHHWTGHHVDAMVTPNHRMWIAGVAGQWKFETSAQLATRGGPVQWRVTGSYDGTVKTVMIPAVSWQGTGRPPKGLDDPLVFPVEAFARLVGYIASEGHIESTRVGIAQTGQNTHKQWIVQDIERSLVLFDSQYVTLYQPTPQEYVWRITHKGFATWACQHLLDAQGHKRLPREVFTWPITAQEHLLDTLIHGDGEYREGGRSATYSTTSEGLADDIQQLCLHAGWRAHKVRAVAHTPSKPLVYWRLALTRTAVHWMQNNGRTAWMTPVPYQGDVWCATVPNATMFTRRNGHVLLSGNSFKPYFMNRKVDITDISQTFQEQQLIELRQSERDIILQTFGMPPEVLGIISNSNRATIEASEGHYDKFLIVPRMELQRETFQMRLVPQFDERLILGYVSPVKADKAYELEVAKASPWARNLDEWRAMSGNEPLPDDQGKLYPVPANLTFMTLEELNAGVQAPVALLDGTEQLQINGWHPRKLLPAAPPVPKAPTQKAQDAYSITHQIADRLTGAMRNRFVAMMEQFQALIDLTALEQALHSGNAEAVVSAIPWQQLPQTFRRVREAMNQAFIQGGQAAADAVSQAVDVTFDFSLTSATAVEAARTQAGTLIQYIDEAGRETVRQQVARAVDQGVPTPALARQIAETVGLTPRQAQAVETFRAQLIADGESEARIARRVRQYQEAQLRRRGEVIARTELLRAANAGHQEGWDQAVRAGHLKPEEWRKVWYTTPDDRLDTLICGPMDTLEANQNVPINGVFTTGIGGTLSYPPAHPLCRCVVSLRKV